MNPSEYYSGTGSERKMTFKKTDVQHLRALHAWAKKRYAGPRDPYHNGTWGFDPDWAVSALIANRLKYLREGGYQIVPQGYRQGDIVITQSDDIMLQPGAYRVTNRKIFFRWYNPQRKFKRELFFIDNYNDGGLIKSARQLSAENYFEKLFYPEKYGYLIPVERNCNWEDYIAKLEAENRALRHSLELRECEETEHKPDPLDGVPFVSLSNEEIAAMTPEHPLYKLVHGEGRCEVE